MLVLTSVLGCDGSVEVSRLLACLVRLLTLCCDARPQDGRFLVGRSVVCMVRVVSFVRFVFEISFGWNFLCRFCTKAYGHPGEIDLFSYTRLHNEPYFV
jgi:hypothetical protein